ncbi:glycerol-3-phosphate dehydrogenase [Sedimenticola thiotaurini]|uniref:Glycerol-3-phosphate dehydrogenase n=1 Tax=Sedimenticola thiotaurini TaxID=1543721 RepID=A0A0F7JY12_9GAMM|nr:glycerol-3-phosphate dehydrogenase [Sedimenticola thiotaurini]AKH19730.1 glycerol-3-phosphate dehydrogenase [Sedimenticola thiotaurini]
MPEPQSVTPPFDLLVIGGGINGVGVARDAAGRGLSVCLCEMDDLAGHTSSASTKLIHGGLRYLEQYDFKLVHHALREREVLLASAPHIIHPIRFVLPHNDSLRPEWMIRLGLFLYDHLGGRKRLAGSKHIRFNTHQAGRALKPLFRSGFEYADCRVADARLVVLNALDAAARGAVIKTHTRAEVLVRGTTHWRVTVRNQRDGSASTILARAVVNAAGPWVERVWKGDSVGRHARGIRFVKGSHIVVPRLFEHNDAYIFQHPDGRVLFAIPFESDFTLLGTTEIELSTLPEENRISPEEVAYICQAVSDYFIRPVEPADVVWSFSGVRPLYDDAAGNASRVTRDYNLHLDRDQAPILSVYGGKITTYRRLAEEVLGLLSDCLEIPGPAWTGTSHLPGGDLPDADFDHFLAECATDYSWLPATQLRSYAECYGTRIKLLLADCDSQDRLGIDFGGGLFEREVRYLLEHEFAETAEDIVWRRTKRGLRMSATQIGRLERWLLDRSA